MPETKNIPLILLAAGLSRRFGGKLKQLARIGPNNETLIEYSLNQAARAGFKRIILIVGDKTEHPLRELLGTDYKGMNIQYAKQEYDQQTRDTPWGTLDALCAGSKYINRPFVICNSDDIYGESALRNARDFIETANQNLAVGYKLGEVLSQTGSVNRGIFHINGTNVTSIKEEIGLTMENLSSRKLSQQTLCSMNLFGLTEEALQKLKDRLQEFKQKNAANRNIECLLPQEIGNLIKKSQITMKILQTDEQWHGLTHPQDEEQVRNELIKKAQSSNQ